MVSPLTNTACAQNLLAVGDLDLFVVLTQHALETVRDIHAMEKQTQHATGMRRTTLEQFAAHLAMGLQPNRSHFDCHSARRC